MNLHNAQLFTSVAPIPFDSSWDVRDAWLAKPMVDATKQAYVHRMCGLAIRPHKVIRIVPVYLGRREVRLFLDPEDGMSACGDWFPGVWMIRQRVI